MLAPVSSLHAAERPTSWATDANGCKFLVPAFGPSPPRLSWDGACVDGYVSGPGTADFGALSFTGEFKQGQLVSGEAHSKGGGSYKGAFKDNEPHGQGVLQMDDGTIIQGDFVGFLPVGVTEITWPNGSHYQGEVTKLDIMHGKGKLTHGDGSVYDGDFLQGEYHGQGRLVWSGNTGSSYTGGYAYGKYHGRGTLIYLDGSRYDGEFASGYQQGKGTHVYADGSRYAGEFVADKRHGQGRHEGASGVIEEGEWKAGLLHGQCEIIYPNQNRYSGACLAHKLDGKGRLEDPVQGWIYEGFFVAGKFQGHGRLTQSGYVYEGGFVDGNRSGRGKEVFETGEQYEGDFTRNLRDGQGVLRGTAPDGSEIVYDGAFKAGAMKGIGKLKAGANSYEGEFKDGRFARGQVRTGDGRKIEADVEANTYFEVRQDGTKVPFEPQQLLDPDA